MIPVEAYQIALILRPNALGVIDDDRARFSAENDVQILDVRARGVIV